MSLYPLSAPPTWQIPRPLLKRQPQVPTAFPQSYAFDPVTGDFVVDSAGRVSLCSGRAAAAQRAAKAASTQRAAYTKVYSRRFGVDFEGILRASGPRAQKEQALETGIRAAVQRRDRRARDAVDFAFEWAEINRLRVTWTLLLADGSRIRQEVALP